MKISSWNVNSVRARIINITNYLKDSKPDVLMMQEIKTEKKNFPFNDFKNLGYDLIMEDGSKITYEDQYYEWRMGCEDFTGPEDQIIMEDNSLYYRKNKQSHQKGL